ncbi:hypothetical protein ACFRSX_32775 [Streptomyces goshikiensis]|uniref:hypothetical protein n=1 Tax=Streptomyces TaxID=1883 RepID=UPI000C27566B|nr:hypothetical protein [Streptomyces sp. CB02120-2]PJN14555.1 hypothetical protein CG724_33220 [Streptomyces sp. CB02120-2]
MTPRPDTPSTAAQLRAAVRIAEAARDEVVLAAETEFWHRIGELSKSYHGAQQDVADALGRQRDYVYKNVRKHKVRKDTA